MVLMMVRLIGPRKQSRKRPRKRRRVSDRVSDRVSGGVRRMELTDEWVHVAGCKRQRVGLLGRLSTRTGRANKSKLASAP